MEFANVFVGEDVVVGVGRGDGRILYTLLALIALYTVSFYGLAWHCKQSIYSGVEATAPNGRRGEQTFRLTKQK